MEGLRYSSVFILLLTNITGAARVSNCTNGVITLTCPTTAGCLLSINGSSFGHSTAQGVACSVQDSDCLSEALFVTDLCHGQAECTVRVPQERPREKCETVSSYLVVDFECVCVTCQKLPPVPFGRVSFSSPYLTAGTTAHYTCETGFPVVGPRMRTCQVDGRWTGVQPACSIPLSTCPPSLYPRRSFGAKCYEFVTSFAPWREAQNDCQSRNGSLSTPEGAAELAYLGWQLEELGLYNYIWVSGTKSAEEVDSGGHPCVELYKPEVAGPDWILRNTTCSFLNAYLCVYEIEQSWHEVTATINPRRNSKAGLGLGIGVGIVLILVFIFCIICRERNSDDEDSPKKSPPPDQDFNQESDIDIYDTTYDDTLPECDVTPSPSPDIHKYAQVDKKNKAGHARIALGREPLDLQSQPVQSNYDAVYAQMEDTPRMHVRPSTNNNTYENVTLHQSLVGSLKKKLTRPWRHQQVATVHIEEERKPQPVPDPSVDSHQTQGSWRKKVMLRQKPQPAPKPVMRRSALEAKLEAIRAGKGRQVASRSPTPSGNSRSACSTPALRWTGRRPGWQEDGEGADNPGMDLQIQSGIEIVENDLYDSDGQNGQLTEL